MRQEADWQRVEERRNEEGVEGTDNTAEEKTKENIFD